MDLEPLQEFAIFFFLHNLFFSNCLWMVLKDGKLTVIRVYITVGGVYKAYVVHIIHLKCRLNLVNSTE